MKIPRRAETALLGRSKNYFFSRELGGFLPLERSLPKDEPPEVPEPVSEEPDFEVFEEEEDEPPPVSDEPDFDALFDEDFSAEEDEADEPEALADSTPSDFAVAESSWPVGFILFAL